MNKNLIDSHIHYDISGSASKIKDALDLTGCKACCLQSLITKRKINQNFDMFYAKKLLGDKVYINGALDSYLYLHQDKMNEMPNYIERMMACGMDGIKMLEGKPTARKRFPIPNFDEAIFDPTFKFLEENQINVTWHVNDPEEFWNEKLVPDWARKSGWFYADGTYVNNIDQYNQIENLLKKHPKLRITFAHFYFLSNNLEYLSKLFDTYPNIAVDITPGIELFTNLSANIENAKTFFNKYSDRIIYGTDISIDSDERDELNTDDAITRKNLCHEFLSKDKTVLLGNPDSLLGSDDLYLNCLNLDDEKIERIEYKNFLNRYQENHKLNKDLILKEIDIHKTKLKELNLDITYLAKIEDAFKN